MKRRMEQLINGKFEYEAPRLLLSDTSITAEVDAGEIYRGELLIGAKDRSRIKGFVMSSDRRLALGKAKFSGVEVSIAYGIETKGLMPGDSMEAVLTINSNLGEYQVPIHICVKKSHIYTAAGELKNFADFVALAQRDFREAYRLFTKDEFVEILEREDRHLLGLYQAMARKPVTSQDMEEFLIAAGKKEPVHISLEQTEKQYEFVRTSLKDSLFINKSTWGYSNFEIETKGEFLGVERRMLSADDFIGSVCELEYFINRDKMGSGRCHGQILIHGVYETIIYNITVSEHEEYLLNTRAYEKKMQAKIARVYEQYCLGEMTKEAWRTASLEIFQELSDTGCFYLKHRLMETFVRCHSDDIARSMSILWPLREAKFTQEQMEEEGIYLMLATQTNVITDAQRETAHSRVEMLHRMRPESYPLLFAYLEMTEHEKKSHKNRMYLYEEIFERGCTSPFMYLEAFSLMAEEPNLLKKLSSFTIQVLSYGMRHGKMTEELAMHIGHLSEYLKIYQKNVFDLLVQCYEMFSTRELLNCVCKYIMKGQPRRREYFKWYAKAVENDLRITRLYEYYIETMPSAYPGVLPQAIRMYLVYNNSLSSQKRAMVYANVIRNKEVDAVTYNNYRRKMEDFAFEALCEGRMNEDYAAIYQECITELTNAETGEQLANVMFTYRLFCDNPTICNVIVCHEQLERETVYPCRDGVAYIQLFTPNAKIIFEDGKRRRFAATVDYNLQKLMGAQTYLEQCVALDVAHYGLILAVCEGKEEIAVKNLATFQRATQMSIFKENYRHKICRQILQYYAEHAGDDTLDSYLRNMDYMTFARVNKSLLVEILIERGMHDMAFEILKEYGYERVRADKVMKMVSRLILKSDFAEDEELLYFALYVFEQGFYDEIILTYLNENMLGSLEHTVKLWERMKGFQMETYELEEKIMLLAMFGRVYLANGHRILKSYVQQGGKQQIIMAYMSLWAYEYFLGEKQTDAYIFECLEIGLEKQWKLDRICRLALLKYYAEKKDLSRKQQNFIHLILKECAETGLRFAFFQKLPEQFVEMYQLHDKQFVEQRFSTKSNVTIRYQIQKEDGTLSAWQTERIPNMYQGIFVKEFLLFYGDVLRYQLSAADEDEMRETQEYTVRMEDMLQRGSSKYQLLNQMLIGRRLNEDDRTETAMKQYLTHERLLETMFRLVE